ncbi:MAG: TonB-dependent receptor plug domain-containing protein [Vulcanimicrobiaceae bacterium]
MNVSRCGRAALAAAVLAILPAVAAAAVAPPVGPSPTPAPAATKLPEIVHIVTSDRHDEPLSQTSRPTFVVDRAAIEARGARTIADALTGVPGFEVLRYGGLGSQVIAGVRSAGSSIAAKSLVLLDGVPIGAASDGFVDLGTLSTVGVARIEVVESGASTLYGTSAVDGVINIITAIPRGAYLSFADGSLGERDVRVTAGTGKLGIAFERHVASNVYDFPALDGFPAGTRVNADAQQTAARLIYATPIGTAWRVRAALGDSAIATGVPGRLDFLTPAARQHTAADDANLQFVHAGAHANLTVTLAGSRQQLAYADPNNGGESATYDGRAQLSVRDVIASARTTFVGGVDLSRESAKLDLGPSGPPPSFSAALSQTAAYAQVERQLGAQTRASLGVRGEHDAPFGSILAPAVGLLINLGDLRLAGNAGESFRVPTIIDLYYPGFSNPALQPEKVRNVDLTASTDRILGGASLGWFERRANDLIVLDTNFVPQNRQRAAIAGFVGTIRTRPLHGLVAALNLTDTYRAVDESPGAGNARLPFAPVIQSTLSLTKPLAASPVGFGIAANIVGAHVESIGSTGAFTGVDAYARVRLQRAGVLTVRVRNLGDERYAAIYGYPAPGRSLEIEFATR